MWHILLEKLHSCQSITFYNKQKDGSKYHGQPWYIIDWGRYNRYLFYGIIAVDQCRNNNKIYDLEFFNGIYSKLSCDNSAIRCYLITKALFPTIGDVIPSS